MKKIILVSLLIMFFVSTFAFANPHCNRYGNEMTRVEAPIGELYICRHCAKDIIINVEIEEDTRGKIDEKNKRSK